MIMSILKLEAFNFTDALQWLARGLSVISVFILILFLVGERVNPAALRPSEWVMMIFFPFGVIIGLVVAWWRERLGSMITISCLLAFYAADFLFSGGFPRGWAFVIFASPSFLFLAHWLLEHDLKQN